MTEGPEKQQLEDSQLSLAIILNPFKLQQTKHMSLKNYH